MITNPHLLPKIRSEAIMQAMQHFPCALRIASFIPGRKCAPQNTVVGCHLPTIGKGMGTKVTDLAVAAGCQHCHDLLDGRDRAGAEYLIQNMPTAVATRMTDALVETQARLVALGIITVSDGDLV
jgi:hypothetical protein